VELLELGVFGWKKLEWSYFFGSGAVWSSPKHALIFYILFFFTFFVLTPFVPILFPAYIFS
jgi:hypothetical protein